MKHLRDPQDLTIHDMGRLDDAMLSRLDDSVARGLSPQRRKPAPLSPERRKSAPLEIRAGPVERGGGAARGAGGVMGRPAVARALHFSRFPAQVASPTL